MMKNNLGNKEIMAKNIRRYMEIHGVDRNDLCQALGIKYTTLSDWVNAKTYPRIDKIEKLANYFGVTKADLVEPKDHRAASTDYVRIPVLGKIAGGIPIEAIENLDDDDWEAIPKEWLSGDREYLALRVKGDSMEPRITDGDIAIIRKQPVCDSGDICAVYINGYSATLKKVLKVHDGSIVLQPTNQNYESKIYTPEQQESLPVVILGKLIELRAKF
ncbi:MAG: XRE family transcriptional regulator [Clostridia bacterium]|nr:XRE family transcriptional regulator [Clostridia bacterium]